MKVQLNELEINYAVSGEGPCVVLLHGWGANLQTFKSIQDYLSKQFKVYSIDLPGFGESQEPSKAWGVSDYSSFLERFVQHFQIEDPVIMGHSNGGRIAIRYSTQHPVNKIVLIDSAGIKPKRKLQYYIKVYTYKAAKQILKLPILNKFSDRILTFMKGKLGSTDYKSVSGVMQQTMTKLVNEDLKSDLPLIKAPALLIWGENDTATPVSDGQVMEKLIPNAGLVVLKNAGHFSYLDKPRDFILIVDHFLTDGKGGSHA